MERTTLLCLVGLLSGIAVRWSVSLGPYSGKGKPPMFGDYEAQRHWMEITQNLNIGDWYKNTSDNDLLYWGLDYPPLQAYHSWLCGYIANYINPEWIALNTSRGFESYEHQIFMRSTVLVTDLVFYFSGVLAFYAWSKSSKLKSTSDRVLSAAVMLFYPGLILIDHGHFQYNTFFLGMTLWAVFFVSNGNLLLGSVCFVVSLNFKQMGLYHALPFFCYLLGICAWKKDEYRLFRLVKIGIIVIATFLACWYPFLSDVDSLLQVVRRIFPFNRGIFEDKVANVWCSLSVLVKYRNYLSTDNQVLLCLLSTVAANLPSAINLFLHPTVHKFKCALVNSSLTFFLLSFHVHEKSILLVALPVCLLMRDVPVACFWFLLTSTFSMFPLLIKDGQVTSYFGTSILFYFIFKLVYCRHDSDQKSLSLLTVCSNLYVNIVFWLSCTGSVALVLLSLLVPAPSRYPDLWPVLISLYSCGHFVLFLVYFHVLQFSPQLLLSSESRTPSTSKTQAGEKSYTQVSEEDFYSSNTRITRSTTKITKTKTKVQ